MLPRGHCNALACHIAALRSDKSPEHSLGYFPPDIGDFIALFRPDLIEDCFGRNDLKASLFDLENPTIYAVEQDLFAALFGANISIEPFSSTAYVRHMTVTN